MRKYPKTGRIITRAGSSGGASFEHITVVAAGNLTPLGTYGINWTTEAPSAVPDLSGANINDLEDIPYDGIGYGRILDSNQLVYVGHWGEGQTKMPLQAGQRILSYNTESIEIDPEVSGAGTVTVRKIASLGT